MFHSTLFKPDNKSFYLDTKLSKMLVSHRYSDYVMIPNLPSFPGMNDEEYILKMHNMKESLGMGEATIHALLRSKKKTCPRVLFLANPDDKLDTLYKPHLLHTYADRITKENQLPFVLHIASHANSNEIITMSSDGNLPPEIFAKKLAGIFNDFLDKNKSIHIIFNACNTAYCDINEGMSYDEIITLVKESTFIGRFAEQMKMSGFNNVTVTGYRGYYSHMSSHLGSVVASDFHSCPEITLTAEKAEYTLLPDGSVKLPSSPAGLFFQVNNMTGKEYLSLSP